MTEAPLEEHLRPLAHLVGRTFRGTLSEPGAPKPLVDVSRWERALNGMAVRNLHSVNDGEYGGETTIFWNRELQTLEFFYFTTAGFFTRGTMTVENGVISTREQVTGNENGITEVAAQSELLADGRLRTGSQYLQNGKWVEGHSGIYVPDGSAEVRFR
ncbi:hypothetical protein FJY68_08420 [candidate division WOR-3 bacterium]|uniref:Uncharacterized protein n=1 Tax=candidate division WOR-3 bacterium TaxID=2052148 RepID=A0A938BTH2_UNCW3|nr:hypothetical protein [candidate division WOR-3 bacterium]